jgi:sulfhydrogenase subunit gamma (sulfur reductase)
MLEPTRAKVTEAKKISADVVHLTLRPEKKLLKWNPGQFLMLSVLGFGEIPVGFASYGKREFDVAVRAVGAVSNKLFEARKGDFVGVRGPFGNGFRIDKLKKRDIILVTGGCGIPPFRSLIHYVKMHREKFGKLFLVYGARSPLDLLFAEEFPGWEKFMTVLTTIDKPYPGWTGCVGFPNQRIPDIKLESPEKATAILCGPPMMYPPVIKSLKEMGLADEDILLSFERRMRCGVGICQHCGVDEKYICKEGPVFSLKEVQTEVPDALG